jgi:Mg-chelatase subunit ChlI-like protein
MADRPSDRPSTGYCSPSTASALGSTLVGLEPGVVTVRAEVTPRASGVARFEIRGLSEEATREARVRVRSAFAASGVAFDDHHVAVTVQDLPSGTDAAPLDLAIAAAVRAGPSARLRGSNGAGAVVGQSIAMHDEGVGVGVFQGSTMLIQPPEVERG